MNFYKTPVDFEYIYLILGDEIECLEKAAIHKNNFRGVEHFIVNEYKLIKSEDGIILCSCDKKLCWHSFKVVLETQSD